MAQHFFRPLGDGASLIEGRSGAAFLDCAGFTAISQTLTPDELFSELDELFTAFDDIATRHTAPRKWACRIGVHSGAVSAGIIGRLKYIDDIFGDGVTTASRMESRADPVQINLAATTRALPGEAFVVEPRGRSP